MPYQQRLIVDSVVNSALEFDLPDSGNSIGALVSQIMHLASLNETELSRLMGSAATARTVTGGAQLRGPDKSLSRSWDEVERANPKPLSDEAYSVFLEGIGGRFSKLAEGLHSKLNPVVTLRAGTSAVIERGRQVRVGDTVKVKVVDVREGEIHVEVADSSSPTK